VTPLLDDPLEEDPFEELDPLLVEPFEVEPPVDGFVAVGRFVVLGAVVVELVVEAFLLFEVPLFGVPA
jgi:hypothetical protein